MRCATKKCDEGYDWFVYDVQGRYMEGVEGNADEAKVENLLDLFLAGL